MNLFQSTHSLRSATFLDSCFTCSLTFQSTHSLRSATIEDLKKARWYLVSIHALLAECDDGPCRRRRRGNGFNPRTPCGVRPGAGAPDPGSPCFNPRTPCGVRPIMAAVLLDREGFQSTHSLRSATSSSGERSLNRKFQSTHSLRSATSCFSFVGYYKEFQSTHSLRSATL